MSIPAATIDLVEVLVHDWAEGSTMSQIATKHGLNRNQIAGLIERARRWGFKFAARPHTPRKKAVNKPRTTFRPGRILLQATNNPLVIRPVRLPAAPELKHEPIAMVEPMNVPMFDNDGCKWPTMPGCCCGHPRTTRKTNDQGMKITGVYCDSHTKMGGSPVRKYYTGRAYANRWAKAATDTRELLIPDARVLADESV